jgi:hypothetical protein
MPAINPTNPISKSNQAIAINGTERWDIYHRLRELDIPCQCSTHKLLSVEVSSPNDLIQVWSVVKQITSSRENLVQLLRNCWERSSIY